MSKSIVVFVVFAFIYLSAALPFESDVDGDSHHQRVKRKSNGLAEIIFRWPNRTVPFRINAQGFSDEDLLEIDNAIDVVEKNTCVKFVEYTDQKSFVTFINTGSVCFSPVGRDDGENLIQLPTASINPKCLVLGTILHEIMHSLGFDHIHVSPDRDEFLKVNWHLIEKKNHDNFVTIEPHIKVTDFGLGYDFDSVMHYHSQAFTTDDELHVMEAHTGQDDTDKMGNVGTLSEGDIARIRAMYNCDGDRPEQDFYGLEGEGLEELTTEADAFVELETDEGEIEELTTERMRRRHRTTRRSWFH